MILLGDGPGGLVSARRACYTPYIEYQYKHTTKYKKGKGGKARRRRNLRSAPGTAMMYALEDKQPVLAEDTFVAPTAVLVGDVQLAEQTGIWYGAVLRADTAAIRVGRGSNVQDNAVLHTEPGQDVVLGENVSVGHSAVVHAGTVGDGTLIGMPAPMLSGGRGGNGCVVAGGWGAGARGHGEAGQDAGRGRTGPDQGPGGRKAGSGKPGQRGPLPENGRPAPRRPHGGRKK